MEVLQLWSSDGYEDCLSLSDNHGLPGKEHKSERTEVYVVATEWEKSRVVHEASLVINKEQAVEVIAYLAEFFKLGDET